MMVRLERAYAEQGHAPLPMDEQELRKIDFLVPARSTFWCRPAQRSGA